MSMNKRSFFARKPSNAGENIAPPVSNNDETLSVLSETSYTSDMSWITSDKNIFMDGIRRLGGDIDRLSRNQPTEWSLY